MHRIIIATALALCAAPARGQDLHSVDFVLSIQNDRLITGAVDQSTGSVVFPSRVKSAVLGAEGFPNFTNDPGFTAPLGDLIPGMSIGFSIMAAPRVWDVVAQGFDTLADERITIRAAGQNIEAPTQDIPVEGIVFGQALLDPSAAFHHHLQYLLNGALPPQVGGVWLLQLQLWTTSQGIEPTEPLYIVFAQGDGEDELQNAIEHIETNLIGTPCVADFNTDGMLNFFDVSAFLVAFGGGDMNADLSGDGVMNFFDVSIFLTAYGAGCP